MKKLEVVEETVPQPADMEPPVAPFSHKLTALVEEPRYARLRQVVRQLSRLKRPITQDSEIILMPKVRFSQFQSSLAARSLACSWFYF
jgi:hypothetical protein